MQGNKKQPTLIFTPDYARGLGELNLYAIYPDYWGENIGKYKGQHNWGEAPCLGYVREQSTYWAKYAAYTAGIVPLNATFKPKAVLIKIKPGQHYHQNKKRYGKNAGNVPGNKV